MNDRDALIERAEAWATSLERDPRLGFQFDAKILRDLISLASPFVPPDDADRAWAAETAKTLFGEGGKSDPHDMARVAADAMARAERAEAKLASLASPSPAQTEVGPRGLRWCQPADDTHDRIWIVRFADQERGEAVFKGPDAEAEARAYFERAWPAWTCWLFATAPWSATSPAQWPEDVVERKALAVASVVTRHFTEMVLGWTEWAHLPKSKRAEIEGGLNSVVVAEVTNALATLPPPEDERVKGLVAAVQAVAEVSENGANTVAFLISLNQLAKKCASALASYRGGA